MTRYRKYLLSLAVFLMGLGLLLPLWRIEIWAPQYPEGLLMQISASSIEGNVDQINILNHYIGMKRIIPDEIPELTVIPWVLSALVALGVLVIVLNRLALVRAWFVLVSLLYSIGLVDLYLWGYDYGHNLDPNAPIKIPGLSYQPPLLGYKMLLNIHAYSLPDWGGYALAFSLILAFCVVFWDFLSHRLGRYGILCLALVSCTSQPEPLKVGVDYCEHCHMQIADARFGGEVITKKGRIYKFDSISCLRHYISKTPTAIKTILVSDYFQPETLIPADTAHFVSSSQIAAPMGSGLAASKDEAAIKDLKMKTSGQLKKWEDLSQLSL